MNNLAGKNLTAGYGGVDIIKEWMHNVQVNYILFNSMKERDSFTVLLMTIVH